MSPTVWMKNMFWFAWALACVVAVSAAQAQTAPPKKPGAGPSPTSTQRAATAATAQARAAAQATALLQAQAIAEAARGRAAAAAQAEASPMPGPALAAKEPTALTAAPDSAAVAPATLPLPSRTPALSFDTPQPAIQAHTLAHTPHPNTAVGELADDQMAVAERVHLGLLPCEMGASVRVEADAARPGFFHVRGKGFRYHMHPVRSSTGAIRLEDAKAGAVWLQLANKSMLMDQTKGRRVADECAHPTQSAYAQGMKTNPPPGLFDASGTGRPKF